MLYRRYGDPRSEHFRNDHLILWDIHDKFPWFPAKAIAIHKDFADRLLKAFAELEQHGLHTEIKTFDEGYNIRRIKGSDSALSVHSWGCAIDMNAAENQLGTAGTWTYSFLEVMLLNGIFCGQNWVGRKDPMHFAMVNG